MLGELHEFRWNLKLMRVKFATLCSLSLNFERRKVANEGEDSGDVLSTEFLEAGLEKKKKKGKYITHAKHIANFHVISVNELH